MKNLRIPFAAGLFALTLSACDGASPLASGGKPSFNGSTMGTGHRSETDETVTSTTASDTTTLRNGSTLGTGH